MKPTHWAWVAGLFDGEGCVYGRSSIVMTISMCDVSCLRKVQRICGGTLSPWISKPKRRAYRRWQLSGARALKVMARLRPWLSPVKWADYEYARQRCPNAGKGIGWRNREKTSCIHGHPFKKENTRYLTSKEGTQRFCLICRRRAMRDWYARNRHTRFWMKYRKR